MAKPATKIWCPKCHKRHRLPANAGGMTLRCRQCKFAFRVQDGLTTDPGPAVDLVPGSDADVTQVNAVGQIADRSARQEAAHQSIVPAEFEEVTAPDATSDPAPDATPELPATLDHDYDDILDVLETPDDDPLAPPRAHAKGSVSGSAVAVLPPVSDPDLPQPKPTREPVTKQQLRAHRNSRQFWMMMSCAVACLLGVCSWVAVDLLMKPTLSHWERKMLYAIGAPARWLPPQSGEEETLLPANHVVLRGDHVELANRNDFFRDDFPDAVVADAKEAKEEDVVDEEVFDRPGNNRERRPNDVARNRNRGRPDLRAAAPGGVGNPAARDRAANRPANRQPQPWVRNNRRPNNRRPNNRNVWQPPELSQSEIQTVAMRGIDPKMLKVFTVDVDRSLNVALAGDVTFSITSGNQLSVFDIKSNRLVGNRKLDKEVAAICSSAPNAITKRPAAWVLYESGKLEKWEIQGGELSRVVVVALRPVFKEKQVSIAAGNRTVAYHLNRQILIANILETASKVDFTTGCPVDGEVLAMRFSEDDSQLLAIVDETALLIDVANGTVISQKNLPELFVKPAASNARSLSISADLSTLFVCRSGMIDAIKVDSGDRAGQYWAGIPVPVTGVVVDQDRLLGFASGAPAQATMFAITKMELVSVGSNGEKSVDREAQQRGGQGKLLGDKVPAPGDNRSPFLLDRSPEFKSPIQAIQMLSNNRIAVLTKEANGNRIAIASWKDGWNVAMLNFEIGTRIGKFTISDDLTRVAIVDQDVIQGWEIVDLEKGDIKFLSESVGHLAKVTDISFTKDGQQIVSGDSRGKVLAFNVEDGKQVGGVDGFQTMIKEIVTKGEGGFVAMDQRGVARGSAHSNRAKIKPFNRTLSGATALTDNGNRLAFLLGSDINVADVNSQKVVRSFTPNVRPDSIQFSRDQKYLLLQNSNEIAVWDWRRGVRERAFKLVATSPGSKIVFGRSIDGKSIAVVAGKDQNQFIIYELPSESGDK